MRFFFVSLFHAIPIAPLLLERHVLLVTSILVVLLPYVKAAKLAALEKQAREQKEPDLDLAAELRRTQKRWAFLTIPSLLNVIVGDNRPVS